MSSAASAMAAVALGFRRRAPLTTFAVVTVVQTVGYFSVTQDSPLLLPAEIVALYSVAVRCRPAIGWWAVGVQAVVQTAATALSTGVSPGLGWEAVLNLIGYGLVLVLGFGRRHRLALRSSAAQQIRAAEARRADAAVSERRRLARELHDVSAHHLTSIVVSGGAAERLAATRPDLSADALTYAAATGRETLRSLHELVAILQTGETQEEEPIVDRITDLAEAFSRLGQQIVVDVTPGLAGPVGEAVFGIVRESLTNTLRHAPGAAVRVLVTRAGDRVDVLVENGRATEPASAQGSRRGVTGMKDRAEALGGTLTAGPGPDGSWQVRASLPTASSAPGLQPRPPYSTAAPVPAPSSAARLAAGGWWTEIGVLLAVATPAVGGTGAMLAATKPIPDAATVSLGVLIALLPGLILLGRLQRPWTALLGVVLAGCLWPLAIGLGWLPDSLAPALALSLFASAAAVYAVATYGGDPVITWLSAGIATAGVGLSTGGLLRVAAAPDDPSGWGYPIAMGVVVAVVLAIPLGFCWVIGGLLRRRRLRESDQTGATLAELVRATEYEVHTERLRIAGGLHHSVLTRTQVLIDRAEAGDLEAATTEARAALTAMRDLLETLDDGAPAPRRPQ
ncbi:histidine kinase [Kribbella sandramycini]